MSFLLFILGMWESAPLIRNVGTLVEAPARSVSWIETRQPTDVCTETLSLKVNGPLTDLDGLPFALARIGPRGRRHEHAGHVGCSASPY